MIKSNTSGFKQLEQSAKEIDGENSVPFPELFPQKFMMKYTQFNSIETMLDESPFKIETTEDFSLIDDNKWDEYIRKVTQFDSWEQMQEAAAKEWTIKKLGL
ncbi:hypothetical protein AB1L07_21460 [Niallia alba]|uniref:hypothetical protein n=1 Tax=Niallia alba TaxID=2729105 RepID=UPI0039A070A7